MVATVVATMLRKSIAKYANVSNGHAMRARKVTHTVTMKTTMTYIIASGMEGIAVTISFTGIAQIANVEILTLNVKCKKA